MKLRLGEVLHMIEKKPFMLATGMIETDTVIQLTDRRRSGLLLGTVADILKAEKFIFDSGMDRDERTVEAVRQTASAMIGAGLFRLPHPLMWVEDPFMDTPSDNACNFYLVQEVAEGVAIRLIQRVSDKFTGVAVPALIWHLHPMVIELDGDTDKFLVPTATHISDAHAKPLAEAVYAVKKLVVTLNSRGVQIEHVRRERERTGGDARRRTYPHSIVHVPLDGPEPRGPEGGHGASLTPRRKHLVRGYVFGKRTRPVEQQKWVQPYWRGDAERGGVERSHYEV